MAVSDEHIIWSHERDEKLRELRARGFSFAEIGRRLGVPKTAALIRHHHLNGTPLPSIDRARAEAHKQREDKQAAEKLALAELRAHLAAGVPMDEIIQQARSRGVRLRVIGEALGVTRQAVYQRAKSAKRKPTDA